MDYEKKENTHLLKAIEDRDRKKQDAYDRALTSELMNDTQFYQDIKLLSEQLNEWRGRAHDEVLKKIESMLSAVFRIDVHKEHYKVVSKRAIAEYLEQRSVANRYADKCIELEKRIKLLEDEIKFNKDYS